MEKVGDLDKANGLVKAFLLRYNICHDPVNHEVPLFTCLLRGDGSVSNKRLIFCYKPNRPLEAALMAAVGTPLNLFLRGQYGQNHY